MVAFARYWTKFYCVPDGIHISELTWVALELPRPYRGDQEMDLGCEIAGPHREPRRMPPRRWFSIEPNESPISCQRHSKDDLN